MLHKLDSTANLQSPISVGAGEPVDISLFIGGNLIRDFLGLIIVRGSMPKKLAGQVATERVINRQVYRTAAGYSVETVEESKDKWKGVD